ncbi:hypothetical protein ACFOEQ_17695 [Chryseobacterium arachidis]|uniref:hypothetical protein n=1 Tax=Chryseobacterium arachidis TaxID=1416778 RepID=UPI003620D08C
MVVIGYDAYKIHIRHFNTQYRYSKIYKKPNLVSFLYDKIHGIPEVKEPTRGKKRKLVFDE